MTPEVECARLKRITAKLFDVVDELDALGRTLDADIANALRDTLIDRLEVLEPEAA